MFSLLSLQNRYKDQTHSLLRSERKPSLKCMGVAIRWDDGNFMSIPIYYLFSQENKYYICLYIVIRFSHQIYNTALRKCRWLQLEQLPDSMTDLDKLWVHKWVPISIYQDLLHVLRNTLNIYEYIIVNPVIITYYN